MIIITIYNGENVNTEQMLNDHKALGWSGGQWLRERRWWVWNLLRIQGDLQPPCHRPEFRLKLFHFPKFLPNVCRKSSPRLPWAVWYRPENIPSLVHVTSLLCNSICQPRKLIHLKFPAMYTVHHVASTLTPSSLLSSEETLCLRAQVLNWVQL